MRSRKSADDGRAADRWPGRIASAFARFGGFTAGWAVPATAVALLGGAILRTLWNCYRPGVIGAGGEAHSVAVAIAQGRGIADAYQLHQGPTAHLLPISPTIAGAVYAVFGVDTMGAEILLAGWSISLALATYFILARVFDKLGTGQAARVGAIVFLSLMPTYFSQEAIDFRVWEGGLTTLLAAVFLERWITAEQQPTLSSSAILALSAVNALLFFVNPIVGLSAYLCSGVLYLRRLSFPRLVRAAVVSGAALAVLITPWTVRNALVLHHPVVLRSNAGLELAVGTDPAALTSTDRLVTFHDRLRMVHPRSSPAAYARLRAAGGEVEYSNLLAERAHRWIAANPTREAELLALHLYQTFFPGTWMFKAFGSGTLAPFRAWCATLVAILGLVGMLTRLVWRPRWFWMAPMLLVIVPAFVLCPFQPAVRYTYLIYPLLTFWAADLLDRIALLLRRRGNPPAPADPAR